jgi:hypothetical protein
MVDVRGRILDCSGYVIRFDLRKVFKDFGATDRSSQHNEEVLHPYAQGREYTGARRRLRIHRYARNGFAWLRLNRKV